MRLLPVAAILGLLSLFCPPGRILAAPNADIYPPQPAARDAIHWQDGYFYINGKPVFLTSGEMHYARIPRGLWQDRLWRSKQMGFNCVQMYVFWNATEGKEGQWDFTDNLDLDAWLSLIQKMGMYAIVRVGPYSCAEWEHGGFPAWLTIKPGMTLRDSGPFLPYADRHLAQIEKIVAKHQVSRGGSVIMVQLENEHPLGWGTDDRDPYLKHLVQQARANGLEIPLFLSGLHHGSDPSGEKPYTPGASPWFTTEFWTGWIGHYGDMDSGMLNEKVRGTWKIVAFGGAGYDYYLVHGGTNFGYSGDSFEATYDYSAPIGEAGQLRNVYFPARRAAWFAQSFSSLLTGSHDDPALARSDLPGLRVTTRTSPTGGSIVFIDNFQHKVNAANLPEIPPSASAYQAPSADKSGILSTRITVGGVSLPRTGGLKVAAEEPRTILVNIPWTHNTTFQSVCSNVMLRHTIGGTDYWVCYGSPGDTGEITLESRKPGALPAQRDFTIDFTYPTDDSAQEIPLDSGDGHKAMFLVMNTDTTKKTWLAHDKLYIGPSFVLDDGSIEFPPEGGSATIYAAAGKSVVSGSAVAVPDLPVLSAWSWRDAAPERDPAFDTTGWGKSQGPQPMESYDGFENRYGWYRTVLHTDAAGPLSLHFSAQSGVFAAFLNGQPASLDHLDAQAGDNTLAILAKIGPRPKLYNFIGPIGTLGARGLWGGVSTDPAPATPDVTWQQWTGRGDPGDPASLAQPTYDDSSWKLVGSGTASQSIQVNRGATWFRGTFTVDAGQLDSSLEGPTFDEPQGDAQTATYLNGKPLVSSSSQSALGVLVAGSNTLLVRASIPTRKGVSGTLSLELWHSSPFGQTSWYFRGGLDGLDETPIIGRVTNWSDFLARRPWQTGDPASPGLPIFWRCTFTYHPPAGMRESIGLLTGGSLAAGHVWLNGHNLGECPQKVPMYMPECWLKDGANDLVIFDLYGKKPDQVALQRYEVHELAQK
jgi:beta-galactosidase